ncbi:hypothetical protein ACH5RR_016103 [Cinchona calisaya]|uniref:Uncharacterized protein n=1 Tax=Cinchona calisaya TaxID=153742 RepID=A0ABD2ZV11_9GENT
MTHSHEDSKKTREEKATDTANSSRVDNNILEEETRVEKATNTASSSGIDNNTLQGKEVIPYYKLYSCADTIDIILIISGTVAAILDGLLLVYKTHLWGRTVDFISDLHDNPQKIHQVFKVFISLLYLGIAASLASFARVSCWTISGERQASNIRNTYLRNLLRQDITFFEEEIKTGEVVGNMSRNIQTINDAIGDKVGTFIKLISTFTGGIIFAYTQAWQLALVMSWVILPIILCSYLTKKTMIKEAVNEAVAYAEADALVVETVASIRTVISLNGEKEAESKYKRSLQKVQRSITQAGILAGGTVISSVPFFVYCSFSVIIWYGSRFVLDHRYSAGDVITTAAYILNGSVCLVNAMPSVTRFTKGQVAASKIFNVISRKPGIDAYDLHGMNLDHIQGDIEFRSVSFTYPSRRNIKVLANFSLTLASGSKTALVGKSGCGKSTVVNLIERYYDPDFGAIFIDGYNLKDLKLECLRKQIGLVSQEPVLLTLSVKDNITFGRDDVTEEEIRFAIALANAEKFLNELPQGLDTMVGENGVQLSGGQKQRISIARAILKNPRILLLDEATSALDLESEQIVMDSLNKISIGRTTMLITHRLSTVKDANKILVLDRGSVVEEGTYVELMDQNGPFSELIQMQNVKVECTQMTSFDHSSTSRSASSTTNKSNQSPSLEASNKSNKTITQLLRHVRLRQIVILSVGLFAIIIKALVPVTFGIIQASVVGTFTKPLGRFKKETLLWSILIAVVAVISSLAYITRTYVLTRVGCWFMRTVNSLCFSKVVYMEVDWFDNVDNSSGAISSRLSTNAATLRRVSEIMAPAVAENSITIIAGLAVVFSGCWELAILTLAFLPLVIINGWLEIKFNGNSRKITKILYEEAGQVTRDAVEHIRTVISLNADRQVMQLFKLKCEGPLKRKIKCAFWHGASIGLSSILSFCMYGVTFYIGAILVKDRRTTSTIFFRALFALTDEVLNISAWLPVLYEFNNVKPCIESALSILNHDSKIDSSSFTGEIIENFNGCIEFQNISFNYSSRPHIQVLNNFCLSIPAGKTVALVGESGTGKSTIFSLLQRFYDPGSGQITIDGIEIQKLNIQWLRQKMALVAQEPVLFNDTIKANIIFGLDHDTSEAEIQSASTLANAHHFISNLPQGYDTLVGERGVQLSGGQKQRIAIARAIVRRAKILLLDEPTSALDISSENVVQEALDKVSLNRTTILAAHRLSTIRRANIIAVMKNGTVTEHGTHESLLKIQNGIYASLVALS